LAVKIKWVAIVRGESGIRNNKDGDDIWTLVFRDEEAELLWASTEPLENAKGCSFVVELLVPFFRVERKMYLWFRGKESYSRATTKGDPSWP
jgi:hypothetical protein